MNYEMISGICLESICTGENKKKWSWNSICNSDIFPVGYEDIQSASVETAKSSGYIPRGLNGPDPRV